MHHKSYYKAVVIITLITILMFTQGFFSFFFP